MEKDNQVQQEELFQDDFEKVEILEHGKDELNFAEFPLSSVYHIRDAKKKELVFLDEIFDKSSGKKINRKVTITASEKFGLPSSTDDEILLGLVQLSKQNNFETQKVSFSRYQLIKILGWSLQASNYARVEESLNRWLNVGVNYENAWRNKTSGDWESKGFHIIERFSLKNPKKIASSDESYFEWGKEVFESLQAGNIKSLNFTLYKSIKSPIAKRIFRFLDKRFYLGGSWTYDLIDFSKNKVGVAVESPPKVIKQRMDRAIKELEEIGFLKKLRKNKRYKKMGRGKWEILFEKGDIQKSEETSLIKIGNNKDETTPKILQRLIDKGVAEYKAKKIFQKYPHDFIEEKIDALEFTLKKSKDNKFLKPKNPAGFLVKAIEEDFAKPDGFKSKEDREKLRNLKAKRLAEQKAKEEAINKIEEEKRQKEKALADARKKLVDDYLMTLDEEQRETIHKESIEQADSFNRYFIEKGGALSDIYKRNVLEKYILELLNKS